VYFGAACLALIATPLVIRRTKDRRDYPASAAYAAHPRIGVAIYLSAMRHCGAALFNHAVAPISGDAAQYSRAGSATASSCSGWWTI
jgi:hypothetical protein